MTYVPAARNAQFMPSRSAAMAMALCLNLALVVIAMRPDTPFTIHAPPPHAILATILQNPPPAPTLPTPPTLPVVNHVMTPQIPLTLTQPVAIHAPASNTIAPLHLSSTTTTATATATQGTAADTNATIAYETATPPAYPPQAVRAGAQGTVLLKVLVDTHGLPVQVMVQHSSGWHSLDLAARKHVLAAWRFHPAVQDGHAIEAWVLVPVRFDLDRM